MSYIKKILYIIIICSMYSCGDLEGTYVGNFSTNCDTIFILPNGKYKRSITSKDGKYIFQNEDKYTIRGTKVTFKNFILNYNDLTPGVNYNPDFVNGNLGNVTIDPEQSIFTSVKLSIDEIYFYEKIDK